MIKKRLLHVLIILIPCFIIISGCKKKDNGTLPVITSEDISKIAITTAQSGGSISNNGGSEVIESGVCWSTGQTPSIENYKTTENIASGSFTSFISGLNANTTYYLRAYATNSAGTAYGNLKSFTTYQADAVTDCDGNYYNTITIGTQVWMIENMKNTKYCNGDPIPVVTDSAQWFNLTNGAYCNYNNDENNVATYGRLYNWFAVVDQRGIAPTGWHVATADDWDTLTTFLGGYTVAGGKLKETGTNHWTIPNTGATNESGFTALPGGSRDWGCPFRLIGSYGNWWTSTEDDVLSGYYRFLYNTGTDIANPPNYKVSGLSVRCVKD
jgi:uncharacterized protein (TIGR02145 family)